MSEVHTVMRIIDIFRRSANPQQIARAERAEVKRVCTSTIAAGRAVAVLDPASRLAPIKRARDKRRQQARDMLEFAAVFFFAKATTIIGLPLYRFNDCAELLKKRIAAAAQGAFTEI